MAEWKKVRLVDVADYVSEKSLCESVTPANYISTENMLPNKGGVAESSSLPSYGSVTAFKVGDILISNIRPYFKKIWQANKSGFSSNDVLVIRANEHVTSKYLFSVLSSDSFFEFVMAGAKGTKMPRGDKQHILEYPISLPPLPTQRKIAAVLGAIDDKIETNRKICANLEAQAQALFKSWFVDFEPFGGEMPKGWKIASLGECCNTVLGGTPSRNESTYWGGDIAWINSGKVNDFRIIEASEFITRKGLDCSAAKLMPAKTVAIAITGATLGQVSLLEIEASANQSVIGIIENEEMPYEFIYPLILSRISDLVNCQTGGAQQHINKNDVNGLRFVRPDKKSLAEYKNHVSAAYELIAKKCFENRHLEDMRDALLPKLMSGEIDVDKVEV